VFVPAHRAPGYTVFPLREGFFRPESYQLLYTGSHITSYDQTLDGFNTRAHAMIPATRSRRRRVIAYRNDGEVDAMPSIIHYVCQRELLPRVEGALAANGYRVEIRGQPCAHYTTTLIMTRGLTSILLTDGPNQAQAAIEIWGLGQALAAQLLESLSLDVYKPQAVSPATLREADAAMYVG
jgi:hypothetical protein